MNRGFLTNYKTYLWILAVVGVILTGVYYMPKEANQPGFWESLYSTLRLFVFERDTDTFPKAWPLIAIYFLAPLITLTLLGKTISYFFKLSPAIRCLFIRDHIIVCGVGRTGKLVAQCLHKSGAKVVGVDQGPADAFEEWATDNNIPFIFGDFHLFSTLKKAGVQRARSVVFASGDDLANLEAALHSYERMNTESGAYKIIWTHISNDRLAATVKEAVKTEGKIGIRIFDTFGIAANKMIHRHFPLEKRKGITQVNIVGYGKFGSDLLEVICDNIEDDETFHIRVIDIEDREKPVMRMAKDRNMESRISFVQEDIRDLDFKSTKNRSYFLCTDDDLSNLSMALDLAPKIENTNVFVRMAHWPLVSVSEHWDENTDMVFVNITDLVKRGLEDMPGIFAPAIESDLKRITR